MANERASKHPSKHTMTDAPDLDASDPLSEIIRMAEQSQAAFGQVRSLVEDNAARVAELARANAVFEAIADRLVAVTLKASQATTQAAAAQAASSTQPPSLALVEELADLARRALLASANGRSHLREYQRTALPTKTAAHEAHTALETLSGLLQQLAAYPTATAALPAIEVETRPPPPPMPEDTTSSWRVSASRPDRYKN